MHLRFLTAAALFLAFLASACWSYDRENDPAANEQKRCSVRVRVPMPDGTAWGSGGIVHNDGQRAVVYTAGHVVRGAAGTILVYPFGHEWNYRATVLAASDVASRVVSNDTAILAFQHDGNFTGSLKVGPPPSFGEELYAIGFGHGRARWLKIVPTRWDANHQQMFATCQGMDGDSGAVLVSRATGEVKATLTGVNYRDGFSVIQPTAQFERLAQQNGLDLASISQVRLGPPLPVYRSGSDKL